MPLVGGETDRWTAELEAEVTERKQAEKVMRNHRDHLKTLVQERTTELSKTIAKLEGEITERKRVEEALREAHLLFEKTFSSLNEVVFVVDPATRTIIACNQAVERIFGYSEHEVVGRNTEFLHVDRAMYEKFGRELYAALDADGVFHTEHQCRRKDGSVLFTEHMVTEIVDDSGHRTGLVSIVRDITERKRAEEALEQAHAELQKTKTHLESLIESSTDAIIATDRDGNIVFFNEGAEALSGYRREEVIGRRAPVLYESEEDAKEVMCLMREDGGTISAFETVFKAKDGSLIPVLISASLLFDEDGQEAGTVGFSKDLRERKRREDEIRILKEFNENVVQSVQDGLLTLDRDFRITFWNKAMEEIRGFKAEEVLGKVITEVFPHVIEQGLEELFQTALDGKVVEGTNFSYQMSNGETVYTNERFLPLKDQAGAVIGALSIVEDVTETLRLEERVIQLQKEIEGRKLVEIAKGVLMREVGLSEAESYKLIQKKSRDENRKMGEVAKLVIQLHGSPEERKKFT